MLGLLVCEHHRTPINIIVSRTNNCAAFCQTCFQILAKQQEINKAVRLNSHTLDTFETFTSYVFEKLQQSVQKVRQSDAYSVFEEVNQSQNTYTAYKSSQISKRIAEEVIQEYRLLIKGNRDAVISQKIPQILYHHEFLKDIYNLVTKSWRFSANMIANNYSQKINQSDFTKKQFRIKTQLIQEIENERMRIVGQKLEFLIVKLHPLLDVMNRGNFGGDQTKNTSQSQEIDISEVNSLDSPVLIKKVQSFQEIKAYINSSKTIEEKNLQTNVNRHRNMKKTKLIDQKGHQETNNNYLALLKELDVLKLENDNLRQQNYSLKSQNMLLSTENKAFKSQSQNYRIKIDRLPSNYKQSQSGLLTQLQNQNHRDENQIQNNKDDLRILIQYIRNLQKSRAFDQNLHKRTISQLKTAQLKL